MYIDRPRISDVLSGTPAVGETVTIRGWVRTLKNAKTFAFINVHDGSCFDAIQVIADESLDGYEDIKKLTTGCSVSVEGEIVASSGAQAIEIKASSVTIIGWVEEPKTYPMQPKRHTREFLREQAHLRPRTNLIGAATRVRNCLAQATHRFFHEYGFQWVHTPIITASDTEGAGEMFRVSTLDALNPPLKDGKVDFDQDFFGKEAFLTVSGQLNVETYCQALSRVYTFGPTFRAENSNTRRHLAEFWMIEPEIAFADLNDDMDLAEAYVKYMFRAVLEERHDDISFFNKFVQKGVLPRMEKLVDANFARMDYTDAIKELKKAKRDWEFPVEWGVDLAAEHERYLCEEVANGPTFVVNYPKDIKAFYMRANEDGKTVAAMDMLAPGVGELIGGSQREERLDVLDDRIREMNLEPDDYGWYRDLRRYGTTPHAGFGLGFERAVQYATGIDNIRDVIPFPRAPRSCDF